MIQIYKNKDCVESYFRDKNLLYGILKTSRGYKCLAKDGTVCLSLAEQRITNWLIDNKIQFENNQNTHTTKNLIQIIKWEQIGK